MNCILKLTDLNKSYGNCSCFSNLSLDIEKSEIISVVGSSGSGKTTLLKVIANLVTDYAGTIMFLDKKVSKPCREIFYIPQSFEQLLPWKTAVGNLSFVIKNSKKITNTEAKKEAMEMLRKMRLEHAANKFPYQLSGGMKQRIAFARALAMNAQVLLLDEPFSSIDAVMRKEMHEILLNIVAEYKTTILFVTHSIEEAVSISDRIVVLSDKNFQIVKNCHDNKAVTIQNIIDIMG